MSKDQMVDIVSDKRELRVPLTGNEKQIWADKLAGLDQRIRLKVGEAKTVAAGFKEEIDELKGQSAKVAEEIRDGELRTVICETTRDYRTGTVVTVRTDTGEIVNERAMTNDERQMRLEQVRRRERNEDEADDTRVTISAPGMEPVETTSGEIQRLADSIAGEDRERR